MIFQICLFKDFIFEIVTIQSILEERCLKQSHSHAKYCFFYQRKLAIHSIKISYLFRCIVVVLFGNKSIIFIKKVIMNNFKNSFWSNKDLMRIHTDNWFELSQSYITALQNAPQLVFIKYLTFLLSCDDFIIKCDLRILINDIYLVSCGAQSMIGMSLDLFNFEYILTTLIIYFLFEPMSFLLILYIGSICIFLEYKCLFGLLMFQDSTILIVINLIIIIRDIKILRTIPITTLIAHLQELTDLIYNLKQKNTIYIYKIMIYFLILILKKLQNIMGNLCQYCTNCGKNTLILQQIKRQIVDDQIAGSLIDLQSDKKLQYYDKVIMKDDKIQKDRINALYPFTNHNKGFLYQPQTFLYEGEIKDQKMNGKGRLKIIHNNNNLIYEGFFKDNHLDGKGRISMDQNQQKLTFSGMWKDNYPIQIILQDALSRQTTKIQFQEKSFNKGKITFYDNKIYNGQFKYDIDQSLYLAHGKGYLIYPNGNKLSGHFVDGYLEGKGQFENINKQKYVGQFKKGLFNGKGIFTFKNGNKLKIDWLQNKPNGNGELFINDKPLAIYYSKGKRILKRISQLSNQ